MVAPVGAVVERYEMENGHYVLYYDGVRMLETAVVAVLVDTRASSLVTHGDPRTVRHECDRLRAMHGEDTAWLLLEGRPLLPGLNNALAGRVDLLDLNHCFVVGTCQEVARQARELLARLTRSAR